MVPYMHHHVYPLKLHETCFGAFPFLTPARLCVKGREGKGGKGGGRLAIVADKCSSVLCNKKCPVMYAWQSDLQTMSPSTLGTRR